MTKYLISLLCSLLIVVSSYAADGETIFERANSAYESGKYDEAIKHYEHLLDESYEAAAIYYNLGNTYYKKGEVGEAILYYEKALKLAPNDDALQHNLELALDQQQNELPPVRELGFMQRLLPSNSWSILAIVLLWLAIAGFILWLIGKSRFQKKLGFILGISLSILSIATYVVAGSKANYEANQQLAILVEEEVSLKYAPEEDSKPIIKVYEGLKVLVLDQIGEWYKVELSDGQTGWVPEKTLERI